MSEIFLVGLKKMMLKKFIQSNKKYVEFRDFLSLVFYNPKKF